MTKLATIVAAILLTTVSAQAQDTTKKPKRDTVAYCEALKRETSKPACFERAKAKAARQEGRAAIKASSAAAP